MDFEILGPLVVVRDGVPLTLGTRKARQVLACLIVHADEIVSIDRLVATLWGPRPPKSASRAIQNHISDLRKVIRAPSGPSPILTQSPGYRLEVTREQIDAHRFEDLVASARAHMGAGSVDEGHTDATAALELWRGDPLTEFTYDEFAQPAIRRLQELRSEARELRFEADIASGRAAAVIADLEAFVDEHPLRDQPRRLLVEALHSTGRTAEANAVRQDYLRLLETQLGTTVQRRSHHALVGGDIGPAWSGARTEIPSAEAGNGFVLDRLLVEELLTDLEREAEQRSRRHRGWTFGFAAMLVAALVAVVVLAGSSGTPIVGLLFAGRGDAGWGDLVASGVDPIAERGDIGLEQRFVSLGDSQVDLERKIGELAERADVVIVAWGFAADAVARVATERPDTMFVMVDAAVDLPNVASYIFANDEGAFLVGAAAALTSGTGQIGFVGAADMPVIDGYLAGFLAGALEIDAEIDVSVAYIAPATEPVRGFVDTVAAADLARAMYRGGVDVVFHAAGGAGAGILEAARVESEAQGRQLWMIGVDVDEHLAAPTALRPHVLTSMVQRADVVVSRAIAQFVRGELQAGTFVVGVTDGAVGYSTSGGHLDPHRGILEGLRTRIPVELSSSTP